MKFSLSLHSLCDTCNKPKPGIKNYACVCKEIICRTCSKRDDLTQQDVVECAGCKRFLGEKINWQHFLKLCDECYEKKLGYRCPTHRVVLQQT